MIKKEDYFELRDCAWNTLIKTKADRLPIKIAPICKAMYAKAISYAVGEKTLKNAGLWEHTNITDGFTIKVKSGYLIFYDSNKSEGRQRFTIGHELGHIAMGHVKLNQVTLCNQELHSNDEANEKVANMFATRILAPACVLHFANILSAEDIARHCNISLSAAQFRAERLKELRKRNMFLTSDLEKQVFTYFKVFIEGLHPEGFEANY